MKELPAMLRNFGILCETHLVGSEMCIRDRLGIAGNVDLLIRFDSFQITERSPLFLLVLGETRDYGKQLPNLISDLISIRFDLE